MTTTSILFDLAAHQARLRRGVAHFAGADFLHRRLADDFADRLAMTNRTFRHVAEIGARGDFLQRRLADRITPARHLAMAGVAAFAPEGGVVGRAEAPPFADEAFDLVLAPDGLIAVNDLPGALLRLRQALKPDGLFLGALAGPRTLQELRAALLEAEAEVTGGAAPRVHPFVDVRDAGALLQRAGFALPVVDAESVTVRYSHPLKLVADLRAWGATNVLAQRSPMRAPKATWRRAFEIYADKFADPDGRVRATFEAVILTAWSPHESQQKPAARGAGRVSLADVFEKGGAGGDGAA